MVARNKHCVVNTHAASSHTLLDWFREFAELGTVSEPVLAAGHTVNSGRVSSFDIFFAHEGHIDFFLFLSFSFFNLNMFTFLFVLYYYIF